MSCSFIRYGHYVTDHYFRASSGAYTASPITVTIGGEERVLESPRGVFSNDGLDIGTRVLLDVAPVPDEIGTMLDLGCGWGPIALHLGLSAPTSTVWAVDVNSDALEATERNARTLSLANVRTSRPEDVPADVQFDAIWSNPPIRIGKPALHELLLTWLPRLTDDGEAWFTVQKHLGSDSLLRWLQALDGFDAERYESKKNFRILRVFRTHPAQAASQTQ